MGQLGLKRRAVDRGDATRALLEVKAGGCARSRCTSSRGMVELGMRILRFDGSFLGLAGMRAHRTRA